MIRKPSGDVTGIRLSEWQEEQVLARLRIRYERHMNADIKPSQPGSSANSGELYPDHKIYPAQGSGEGELHLSDHGIGRNVL